MTTTAVRLSVPPLGAGASLTDGALAYAGAGWYVIPVDASKNPGSLLGKGWPGKSSRDPETIRNWFASPRVRAIALHVGKSGAVAFDVDHPEELAGPIAAALNGQYTGPFQATRDNCPGRGHYLFSLPEGFVPGNSNGGLGKSWGDVRGKNGVIIVQPSVHEKPGGLYRWERTGELPVLPDDLRALLSRAGDTAGAASAGHVADFIAAHSPEDGDGAARAVRAVLGRFGRETQNGGSRHIAAVGCACQIAEESAAGAYAAGPAFAALEDAFRESVRGENRPASEWPDILAWAVGQTGEIPDAPDGPLDHLILPRDDLPVFLVSGKRHAACAAKYAPDGWGVVRMDENADWGSTDLLWAEDRKIVALFSADFTADRGVHDAASALKEALAAEGASAVAFARLAGARARDGLCEVLERRPEDRRSAYVERIAAMAAIRLGRPPARKAGSSFFTDKGGLKATTTADAVLAGQPAAIARGSMISLYRDGAFRVDRGREPLYAMLVKLLGEDYRPNWRTTVEETLLGILYERGMVLPEHSEDAVLNCRNGMLDLRTGELTDHDPQYLSAIQVPVAWNPDAKCPRYEDWMHSMIPDQADHLEEIAGTMLDPSRTPQKAAFLFGPSRSGKSTFLRIMAAVSGEGNISAVSLHQLADNKFMSSGIYQKMLNVSADLSSAHVKDTSLFKMMIGEDVIEADRKYGHTFRFTNKALFAFSANEIPTVSETSQAYIQRIAPFKFGTSFAGREDPTIETAMMDELPGILFRWVAAWQRFSKRGLYLPTGPGVMAEFETKSDRVARWAATRCTVFPEAAGTTVGPDQGDTLTGLYGKFKLWVKEDGPVDAMSRPKFSERLRSIAGVGDVYLRHRNRNMGVNVVTHEGEDREIGHSGENRSEPADIFSKNSVECVGCVGSETSSTYVRDSKKLIMVEEGTGGTDSHSHVNDVPEPTQPTHEKRDLGEGTNGANRSHEDRQDSGPDVSQNPQVPLSVSSEASGNHRPVPGAVPDGRGSSGGGPVQEMFTVSDEDPFADTPGIDTSGPIGFDLETASATEAFTYGPGFVRLAGVIDRHGTVRTGVDPAELVAMIGEAPEVYGHNALGFDGLALAHWHGMDWEAYAAKAVDTEPLARQAHPPRSRGKSSIDEYDLDHVAERYGVAGKTNDIRTLARKHGGFDRIPREDREYNDYLRGDLEATRAVRAVLPRDSYTDREHRILGMMGRMTLSGFRVDVPLLETRLREGAEKKREALEALHGVYGLPLGREVMRGRGEARKAVTEAFSSPLATREGNAWLLDLWNRFGVVEPPRTGRGRLSTAADRLDLVADNPRCPEELRRALGLMRTVTTTRTVYQTTETYLTPEGRVHPKVSMRQASGRGSVTEPGMTVFGKRGGKHVERDIFIADEGHVIITCDLSQVDMRGVAALCQDPLYMEMFDTGKDMHTEVAAMMGIHRDEAKPLNHGYNYGMGAKAMINDGHDPALVAKFFEVMGRFTVKDRWTDSIRSSAMDGEQLDNGFGRLMRCDPHFAYTVAPALMGQGSARDITCEVALRLIGRHPEYLPYLRTWVHDEFVLSVPEEEAEEIGQEVKDAFTWEWRGVPILCDLSGPGASWGSVSGK